MGFMQSWIVIIYLICFFVAFTVLLESINNAFKKGFLWGMIILMFPVGTYFYYKKFFTDEKTNAIKCAIWLFVGLFLVVIAKCLG